MSYPNKLNENNITSLDKRHHVRSMFNSIYRTYDLLNHLLSLGVDIYWRKKSLSNVNLDQNSVCLDLAAGTGDYGLEVHKKFKSFVIGYDIAENSLLLFKKKIKNKKLDKKRFLLINGEAENISLKDSSVDLVTIAFGIRNFYDSQKAVHEIFRILKVNGTLLILEFGLPKNPIIRKLYKLYFEKILPLIGRMISKSEFAYKYLPESVRLFEQQKDIISEIIVAGFRDIKVKPMTFGIVNLYEAKKVSEEYYYNDDKNLFRKLLT